MDEEQTGAMAPDNAWRQVVASLADAGRLEVLARVVTEGPAEAVLSTDERRRLAPLLAAGVVVRDDTGFLRAAPERFAALLATVPAPRPTGPERFLVDGRLLRSPKRLRDRELVVRFLAARVLPLEEPVTELTLTKRLAERAADPVSLRRAMVDAGLVHRTRDGAEYWRTVVTEFDDV
ncbi:hypothetical protein JOE63_000056 [Cellulosimicrobium cellulans]|uniref:DUF2087 domain-containing protein n=1 Tax=Cellulosimicrobium cellulans TaxID=1710 RepID=UPI0027DC3285|nr:DUF2087 domain-containing protein [Cellulosimicrobium cellulans]MBM7817579.1 hypothetical protein [Cellulosimicrobium cellulans]